MTCSAFSDNSFGPRVGINCRSFDFTLQFEDMFFACLPSALFILLAPSNIVTLLKKPADFSFRSKLLAGKSLALALLIVSRIILLALRSQTSSFQTLASLAADILAVVATIFVFVVSTLNHQRSPRPSTLLSLYLSCSVILTIARVRTAWLLGQGTYVPAIFTFELTSLVAATVLESIQSKRRLLTADIPTGRNITSEQSSGFWARTCFLWLTQTFYLGYSRVISLSDLPRLDPSLESRALHKDLNTAWDKYDHQRRHSLLRACFWAYIVPFLSPVLPRLCLTAFTFTQPILIKSTVAFVSQMEPDANYGRGLIGAWALVYVGIAVSNSIYQYHNLRFTSRLRGGLIALIYEQAVNIREVDVGDITAVALMGTDVERIFGAMSRFHTVWGTLLDIAVASWLLGLQLSIACLAPIVLVLVFIASISRISIATQAAQLRWIEKIQERLRMTSTMLGEMKAVKMLGLTQVMSNTIQGFRNDEINTSRSFRKLLVATLMLSLTPINLAPVVTFGVYVVISIFWKNETLLPAQAFTSLALVALLTTPVITFIQLLPTIVQSLACFNRIQEFCNYGTKTGATDRITGVYSSHTSQSPADEGAKLSVPHDTKNATPPSQVPIASFAGESFGWKQDQLILHNINIDIPRYAVTVIVGPVGSGKSAFLSAVLGDLVATAPSSAPSTSRLFVRDDMAYCSQTPWLENGTIRENIIGVSSYEQKWYDCVTNTCCLDADLQALPKGDFTVVGSKGVNLSGGQKQRIALARAVYSRCKIALLDDVFSGMDAHTSHHVSTRLVGPDGLLRRHKISVVMVTHNHKIMALADNIISLENGTIVKFGSSATFATTQVPFNQLNQELFSDAIVEESRDIDISSSHVEQPAKSADINRPECQQNDTRRKNGEKAVYTYYLKHAGWKAVVMYTVSVVMWIFFSEFSTVWVKWWSEAHATEPNMGVGYYMGIYGMLGILGTLSGTLAAWFAFLDIISNTAINLHSDLLRTTLAFSEDMQLIDMDLPSAMVNYTSMAVSVMAKVIVLAVFSQYLGITLPFLATLLYFLQRFYLLTSRQIRLLGIEAKAPLYSHFAESVAGGATIRAFRWQGQYQGRNYRHIDASQCPSYVQSCIQSWLTFVLNLVVAVLAVLLMAIVVTWHGEFSPGSVGVSLVMVIGFGEVLAHLIQNWTKLESSIGAVARVRRFVSETASEETSGRRSLTQDWPRAGALNFSSVVASYGPGMNPVLKGVSLTIEAGQHVAICGRSGSGKTSLIMSFLQMMDLLEGRIELDGVDISTLIQNGLRSCVNVIPQDPFLMPGTIRFNINPFGAVVNDEKIIDALRRVGMWTLVQEKGGLDTEMDVKAWSAGHKQLLCLARAMMRQSKILILDEAMSNVDAETESAMQNIVDTEFRDCTVLAVMHKLKHTVRYDKVALISDGKLLEFGEPASLISGETCFADLYRLDEE
ncbi:Canalicular multispecific organic anion transporter 2-like protein 2 [Colletotrichum chlorophyti]|uniref:Canalicular multispecific organic anion transporter 2-like protein 2 n=1 Tax=Colletotrichum chlorophyti TaxID=708187 RepID=A0A1Q8RT01_9PEZI|nr:Canalicular multispecific organic anion transporter 2-like protein 2 [Colletotrichum chlorophyti]